jgi:hypothetical protein
MGANTKLVLKYKIIHMETDANVKSKECTVEEGNN